MDSSAQWPQGFGVVKGVENPSSSGLIDQRKKTLARPQKDQIVNCPRCNSVNTKFCYYNNYSLSQPRYFCKTCRRYWTAGGSLRNVPVGGGSRKNRRSSSSASIATSSSLSTAAVHAQAQAQAHQAQAQANQAGHDLNLSFHPHPTTTTSHDDLHRHHQYPNPTFTTTKSNFTIDHYLSNTKLLSHHLPNTNSPSSMTPLLPPMGLFKNSLLGHDSSREMLTSLMNPNPEHYNNSTRASIFSLAGFPPIHQDQFKPSSHNFSLDRFSNDHDGYVASSLQLGVQQQSSDGNAGVRLLFPFNQQDQNMNKEPKKQAQSDSAAASSDVQFDHQQNINISSSASVQGGSTVGDNGSSAGFWTGMLSGGSW